MEDISKKKKSFKPKFNFSRLLWWKRNYSPGEDDGYVEIGVTLLKIAPNGSAHQPEGLPTYMEAHTMGH